LIRKHERDRSQISFWGAGRKRALKWEDPGRRRPPGPTGGGGLALGLGGGDGANQTVCQKGRGGLVWAFASRIHLESPKTGRVDGCFAVVNPGAVVLGNFCSLAPTGSFSTFQLLARGLFAIWGGFFSQMSRPGSLGCPERGVLQKKKQKKTSGLTGRPGTIFTRTGAGARFGVGLEPRTARGGFQFYPPCGGAAQSRAGGN